MVHINKYSVLFLLFFLTGCSGNLLQPSSRFPEIKPPKLLFNSGILKLHRKIKIPANDFPETLKLSPDGRYLAVTTQNSEDLIFWDLKTGKKIRAYRTRIKGKNVHKNLMLKDLYFLPDSKTVLLYKLSDSYPETYRIDTLLDLEENKETTFRRPVGTVISNLHFSPDGKYISSSQNLALTKDNQYYEKTPIIQLIDAKTWKEVASVKKGHGPADLHFTKDGKYIIDCQITGDAERPASIVNGHPHTLQDTDYEPGPARDAFIRNFYSPEIRFWSVPDLTLSKTFDNIIMNSSCENFNISQDEKYFAVVGLLDKKFKKKPNKFSFGVKIIDLSNGETVHTLDETTGYLSFSHTGKYMIVANNPKDAVFKVFDTTNWVLREQLAIELEGLKYFSRSAASENGKRLAMRLAKEVYVFDIVE